MQKKILIVDDDLDILEPLSMILEAHEYTVQTTHKGEETYRKIATFKPDLILLDILMSGSDGRTICKQLKANSKTTKIPIIMMSAHPSAKFDSANAGADDFIAKPFEVDELIETIAKTFEK